MASVERSYSCFKRIKYFFRNKCGQERLSTRSLVLIKSYLDNFALKEKG